MVATETEGGGAPRRIRSWLVDHGPDLVLAVVVIAVGVVLRRWILRGPLGGADLDEATVGVQALRFGRGELATFFPNQPYGGTVEPAMVSVVIAAFGATVGALKIVPILCCLAAAVVTWRAAIRLGYGRLGQWVSVIFVWCGPAFAVAFSTKERGFYGVAILLSATYVLQVLRLDQQPNQGDLAMLGVTVGIGWWQTPLTMLVSVPACVWLLVRKPYVARSWHVAAALAAVGCAPWLVWNARNDWKSLNGGYSFGTTWWQRVEGWVDKLRVVVGIETPFDPGRALVGGRWTGAAILALLVAGATYRLWDRATALPIVLVVGYGMLYALNGLAAGVGRDPRYTYLLVPIVALVVGAVMPDVHNRLAVPALVLAVLVGVTSLSAWGIDGMEDVARIPEPDKFLASPGVREVADLLEAEGRTTAITDIAGMQITYLTHERVKAGSISVPRYRDLELAGRRARRSTYVLDDVQLANADRLKLYLAANDIPNRQYHVGKWWVFFIDRRVLPEDAGLLAFDLPRPGGGR